MKTKINLILKCHNTTQVQHTSNPVCLLQMSDITTMQCNYTDLKGKPSLNNQVITIVFLLECNSPQWARAPPPSISILHDHTQTHHTRYDSSVRVIGPTQRPLSVKRHKSMAPGGIRSRNPCKRAATDPRLRPRGHWNHHLKIPGKPNFVLESMKICEPSDL